MPDPADEPLWDEQARSRLIDHAYERLRRLTSQMLRGYPGVHRWEETDDVLQQAMIRLHRALREVKPKSLRHFYNLATLQIRRELIDLARHYLGPQGHGAKHNTDGAGKSADNGGDVLDEQAGPYDEPDTLEAWTTFHEKVDLLPEEEREVFGLLWYEGLTQEKVAEILGIALRTVKRRRQSARLKLAAAFRRSGGDQ